MLSDDVRTRPPPVAVAFPLRARRGTNPVRDAVVIDGCDPSTDAFRIVKRPTLGGRDRTAPAPSTQGWGDIDSSFAEPVDASSPEVVDSSIATPSWIV